MQTLESNPLDQITGDEHISSDSLFVVWFDQNCGLPPADWWCELPALPLPAALDLAAFMRKTDWICKVIPDGQNPRPDGRWDNPV
ncbi:hypothetical protein G3A40_37425 [Paraburkholderia aspalathi]|uniref:hypothetical protein n=1 Tax=Paraburkholderia aspalathi TaxID=1324617 RepID=UPI00190E46C0|nr:hypothetical protein [Paraburkholderia aspalathi]MBK3865428.1 hypothetical protein [Paraburkholderia aspalathi]